MNNAESSETLSRGGVSAQPEKSEGSQVTVTRSANSGAPTDSGSQERSKTSRPASMISSSVRNLLNSDTTAPSDPDDTVALGSKEHKVVVSTVPSVKRDNLYSLILKELEIDSTEKIDHLDKEIFDKYISIRLTKELKALEKIRQSNLIKLNELVDKYISSDKFDEQTLNKLLDAFAQRAESESSFSYSRKRAFDSAEGASPQHPSKRRGQPVTSETSVLQHQLQMEQYPSLSQPFKLAPPSGSQWGPSQYHPATTLQPSYPQYQGMLGPQGGMSPGVHLPKDKYEYQQGIQRQQSQPPPSLPYQTQLPQLPFDKQYIGQQLPQVVSGFPATYYSNDGRLQPMVGAHLQGVGEEGYPGMTQSFQQTTQYRTNPQTVRRGHRRTQSAMVSIPPDLRSPNRAAQRPVNFLIHTPKHPPPT